VTFHDRTLGAAVDETPATRGDRASGAGFGTNPSYDEHVTEFGIQGGVLIYL